MTAKIQSWIASEADTSATTPVLMISGAQGIGKSTALNNLGRGSQPKTCVLSLDDFYLQSAERIALGKLVHPLCKTRGAPGTHDLRLLQGTIEQLKTAKTGSQTVIPRFDKRSDDRAAISEWHTFIGRPDVIVIEGWLMGIRADALAAKSKPLNRLEAEADPDGVWRAWQEDNLAAHYAQLWDQANAFLHLDAPNFEIVYRWRVEQEETTQEVRPGELSYERTEWVAEFIQHYERLTRRMLARRRRNGAVINIDQFRNFLSFEACK